MFRLSIVVGFLALSARAFAQAPGAVPPAQAYPAPAAPPASSVRTGVTFEAAVGLGVLLTPGDSDGDSATHVGLAGLNVGLGGFITPAVALSLRIAGLTVSDGGEIVATGFAGPSAQIWASDHLWFRGGIGLGFAAGFGDGDGGGVSGLAFDAGVGYSWPTHARNAYNVSVEVIPFHDDGVTVTSVSLLLGFQVL